MCSWILFWVPLQLMIAQGSQQQGGCVAKEETTRRKAAGKWQQGRWRERRRRWSLFSLIYSFYLFLLTIVYRSDPLFCRNIMGKRRQDSIGGRNGDTKEAYRTATATGEELAEVAAEGGTCKKSIYFYLFQYIHLVFNLDVFSRICILSFVGLQLWMRPQNRSMMRRRSRWVRWRRRRSRRQRGGLRMRIGSDSGLERQPCMQSMKKVVMADQGRRRWWWRPRQWGQSDGGGRHHRSVQGKGKGHAGRSFS